MSLSISAIAFPQNSYSYDAAASNSASAAKPSLTSAQVPTQTSAQPSAQTPTKSSQTPADPDQGPPKPTEDEQLQELVALGESNEQIATALGLTVTQVEQTLAGTSTASTTASSVVALAGRLSIKV